MVHGQEMRIKINYRKWGVGCRIYQGSQLVRMMSWGDKSYGRDTMDGGLDLGIIAARLTICVGQNLYFT